MIGQSFIERLFSEATIKYFNVDDNIFYHYENFTLTMFTGDDTIEEDTEEDDTDTVEDRLKLRS